MAQRVRCINFDWLEVHVLESYENYPCNADFYRQQGFEVREREYGTRVYNEMFTVCDVYGDPMLEVRRNPKSDNKLSGILDPRSNHIRLVNRYCYFDNPIGILREFLVRFKFEFRRIFRLDICLDFERFDSGDAPQDFVRRYVQHRYAKINQCNRTTHGQDRWHGCVDNYISWGNPKSMVSTKLYNKTLELREAHDKPYIKQSWMAAGLLTNPVTGVKVKTDGTQYTPNIWRLEFSIKNGSAGWAILEDYSRRGRKLHPVMHRLEDYDTPEKLILRFATLTKHYFHFKHFEEGKRKDRCRDKVLFFWKFGEDTRYKLAKIASAQPPIQKDVRLLRQLLDYQERCIDPNIYKACNVIIDFLQERGITQFAGNAFTPDDIRELRLLLQQRVKQPEEELQVTLHRIRTTLFDNLSDAIF